MKVHVVATVMVVVVAAAAFKHVEARCEEGTIKDDGCNTCTCYDGKMICTGRQCDLGTNDCTGEKGSYWMDNCHMCTCDSNRPSCVLMPDCVHETITYPLCKGKTTFLFGCNTCFCGNSRGIPACTKLGCH